MAGPLDELRRAVEAERQRLDEQLAAIGEAEQSWLKLQAVFGVPDHLPGQQPSSVPERKPPIGAAEQRVCALPGCGQTFERLPGTRRLFCSVVCRNRANSRARGPRQRRQRKPANGGTEAASDPALGAQVVALDVGAVVALGEAVEVCEGAAGAMACGPGSPHDSNGASVAPQDHNANERLARQKACAGCGGPVRASRRASAYRSDPCRERAHAAILPPVDPRNAWLFALHPALYRVLDHRAAVRLRPQDLEKVERHRARPL